uniref:NADH-ubiquinone oxidoreductase chain 2 n=1 Tax=Chaetopleura apiculata TaxID=58794 RepID=A0A343S5B0_CHAAP|nr:NADH dehydrogenase subunit 2 [Chaetopleura apiculata]
MLFFGTAFSLCSAHWFGVWIGLEINLMAFIPILVQNGLSEEVEAGVKYFLVQAAASALLLFSSMLVFWEYGNWEMKSLSAFSSSFLIFSSLLLKLGMSPFHFWVPSVVSGLSWFCNLLLLTWQKISPLFIVCFFFSMFKELLFIFIMFSCFFGSVGGINQTSVRGLLSYSSIFHVGWMVSSGMISSEVCFFYLFFYSFILIFVLVEFEKQELKTNKQFNSVFLWSGFSRFYISMMILSMGGMPPMLGFFMKWAVLLKLILMKMVTMTIFLIIGSMVSLYYYLVLSFSIMLSSNSNLKVESFWDMKILGLILNFSGVVFLNWIWLLI